MLFFSKLFRKLPNICFIILKNNTYSNIYLSGTCIAIFTDDATKNK